MNDAYDVGVREGMEKVAISKRKALGAMAERAKRSFRAAVDLAKEQRTNVARGQKGPLTGALEDQATKTRDKLTKSVDRFKSWSGSRPKKPVSGKTKALAGGAAVGVPALAYAASRKRKDESS